MTPPSAQLGQPLRFTALSNNGQHPRGLLLLQAGTANTDLLTLTGPTPVAVASSERLVTASGHALFESKRLDLLCAGWNIDNEHIVDWRADIGDLLEADASHLRLDVRLRHTPASAIVREVGPSEFGAYLADRSVLVRERPTGRAALLASTEYHLYAELLPEQMPNHVRWQECLGDVLGVEHRTNFVALFYVDDDGACTLFDLLSYGGTDLRRADPYTRLGLLREVVAETSGAGARWGSWRCEFDPVDAGNLTQPSDRWRDLVINLPGSVEQMVLLDPF